MRLSIIIPVLNEAETVTARLTQLKNTIDTQYCEVIVVDGGSSDETCSLAKPLSDHLIFTEKKGRAIQMNAGTVVASGDIYLFLHADTQLPPTFFEIFNSLAPLHWGFFHVKLDGKSPVFRIIESMINLRSTLTKVATGDQCLFISQDLFQRLDGYADIPLMEDVEISKRLRKIHKPIIIKQPVITSSRRWQKNGVIKTIILMWWLRLQYFFGVTPDKLVKKYYTS